MVPLLDSVSLAKPCLDCTKDFCLKQNFDFCPSSLEDTTNLVTAECFQRESIRDELIVIIFLFLTGSLVLYAAVIKGLIAKRKVRRESQYNQLPTQGAH